MTRTEYEQTIRRRDARQRRRADLIRLEARPTPWTIEQWREWAAVKAADILDHGYPRRDRYPDGSYIIDRAFAVAHRGLVSGPFNRDTTRRELGHRAANLIEQENAR